MSTEFTIGQRVRYVPANIQQRPLVGAEGEVVAVTDSLVAVKFDGLTVTTISLKPKDLILIEDK